MLIQVGTYDPFCDDPRLAVQKIHFDAGSGQLVVGGRAGHVIVYDLENEISVFWPTQYTYILFSHLWPYSVCVFKMYQ